MGVSGDIVIYQSCFTRKTSDGGRRTIDLHRKINNSQVLSGLFSYEELRAVARWVADLGEAALIAGPVHALLHACLHPATHEHNPYFVDDVHFTVPTG